MVPKNLGIDFGTVSIRGKQSKGSEHYLPKGMRFWSVNIIGHGA